MADISIIIPGIDKFIGASYVDTLGLLPSAVIADIVPQATFPFQLVPVLMGDGLNSFTLPDCAMDRSRLRINREGQITQITLLDRRWYWKYGEINGGYNHRNLDGTIKAGTEKTPRELATLLLTAMGETGFDVSQLPNTERPEVYWECAVPADELAKMLHSYGCDMAMNWITNTANIVRLGVGANLPNGSLFTVDFGVDVAQVPAVVKACANRTIYQSKLKITPMAKETDGEYVPYDEVSYEPAGGWIETTDPYDLLPGQPDTVEHALANESVYRVFKIEEQSDGTQDVPDYGEVEDIEDLLPISHRLAESSDSGDQPAHAFVQGKIWLEEDEDSLDGLINTVNTYRVKRKFVIDGERGLIFFDRPMVYLSEAEKWEPAELYIMVSYHVKTEKGSYARYARQQNIPNGLGTHVERRDDIERTVIATYTDDGLTPTGTTDNDTVINAELDETIEAAKNEFETEQSTVAGYNGTVPISLSGRVRQVAYTVRRHGGARTIAYWNNESEYGVLKRHERIRVHQQNTSRRDQSPRHRKKLHKKGDS